MLCVTHPPLFVHHPPYLTLENTLVTNRYNLHAYMHTYKAPIKAAVSKRLFGTTGGPVMLERQAVAIGLASHWLCVTDVVVYTTRGLKALTHVSTHAYKGKS